MPAQYTERFSESHRLLAATYADGATTEQNTTFVNVGGYHRVAIVIHLIDVGTSLDADVEIAEDSSATNLHTLKSITQLTQAGSDDASSVCIEVRTEELVNPSGASGSNYEWLRVETTPSGACDYVVAVFGIIPRFSPVATTEWDEVVA